MKSEPLAVSDSLENIKHLGKLIDECRLEGEKRSDNVVLAHPSGIQLSRNRWLILYATRKFRGTDDDASIVYQIRADTPDGNLIKEGMIARSIDDWDPFEDGKGSFVKQHGHPSVFGIPKDAMIAGKPAENANVFVLMWRMVAREFDPVTNVIQGTDPDPELVNRTTMSQWTQVRLNEDENDIEFLQQVRQLRQDGYGDEGEIFCSVESARRMAQGYTPPAPFNRDCTEWVVCNHFGTDLFVAIKFRFNKEKGIYDWIETGPYLFPPRERLSNAGLAPYGDSWVCAVRTDYVISHVSYGKGLKWVRMEDPFSDPPAPIHKLSPEIKAPIVISQCPDGVLRLFSSDASVSPYNNRWNPLYCWNIDPDTEFEASNRRVVFDTVAAGLPFRKEAMPKADMCKPLFHTGNTQYLIHRVSAVSTQDEHIHTEPVRWIFPPINESEKASCAIYCARVDYGEANPPRWEFVGEGG